MAYLQELKKGTSVAWIFCIVFIISLGKGWASEFKYHTNEEMETKLDELAKKYPKMVDRYEIGESTSGTKLTVTAVSSKYPSKHITMRPEVKLVGNMHGDEAVGREMIIKLAEYLVENGEKDRTVGLLMNRTRIHLLPSLNPDGFANAKEGCCQTRAIMDWLDRVPFVLSANFHGGQMVVNYPYDTQPEFRNVYSKSPDDDVFRQISKVYAKNNPSIIGSKCGRKFKDGITNGADWYFANGTMQDYNYIKKGILATTIELSCCKYPKADTLESYWSDNRVSILKYILQAQKGIRGVLRDYKNPGIKVKNAKLEIKSRKSVFYSTGSGEFWRILEPGVYKMHITARGYKPRTATFRLTRTKPLILKKIKLFPFKRRSTTKKEI